MPPGAALAGSIAARRRAAATSAGVSRPGNEPAPATPAREPRSAARSASTAWSVNERRSRPRSSSPSRSAIPVTGSPVASAVTKVATESPSARPSRSRTASAVSGPASPESSWSRIDSASRIPPSARCATRAMASGSAARPSAARIRRSFPSMTMGGSGRKSNRWTRDRTAGRTPLESVVQKTKRTCGGGSSSVLRRTSHPCVMRWTSSTMNTFVGRSAGAV